MAEVSLGVPWNPSGALGEASGILGGPSEGPQGSLGGKNCEKQRFLIRFEKRVRAEPGVNLETRGPRRTPGRVKSGSEGELRRALGETWDVMC